MASGMSSQGCYSKGVFKSRYNLVLGGGRIDTTSTAVLFSVHFDRLADLLGPQPAIEVVKAFGQYVRTYFEPFGAFSARHSRGEVLTMLPHIGLEEAEPLVQDFAKELQERGLPEIKSLARCNVGAGAPCGVAVTAGITDCCAADKIEEIMEKAETSQKVIVTCLCAREVSAK